MQPGRQLRRVIRHPPGHADGRRGKRLQRPQPPRLQDSLAVVALLPIIVGDILKISNLSIGGTSVIIVVGVALETVAAMEAQMLMRHYKGFLE